MRQRLIIIQSPYRCHHHHHHFSNKKSFSKMYVAFSGWSELDFSIGLLTTSLYQLQIEDSPMFDRHVGCQTFKPSQESMKTRGLLINASASSVDQRCQLWGKGGMLLVSNGLIHVIINLSKPRHKIGPMFATKSSSFSMWARAWSKLSRGNSSSTSYWCQPTKLKR